MVSSVQAHYRTSEPHAVITKGIITCGAETETRRVKPKTSSHHFPALVCICIQIIILFIHCNQPGYLTYAEIQCCQSSLFFFLARRHPVSCSSSIMVALRPTDSTEMLQRRDFQKQEQELDPVLQHYFSKN
jgi:hypothetical protein